MHRSVLRALTLGAIFLPSAALAHPGHGDAGGLVHGFLHPLGGLDHVLAMVTVGMLAAQLGGRAIWLVPASFVTVMVLGGMLGLSGATLPTVEIAIAVSVVALGAVVALGLRMPVAAAMAMVGAFAVFHGYAHSVEMPGGTFAVTYAAGFIAATAMLHAAGIALGLTVARGGSARLLRVSRAAVAAIGAVLLTGAI
jgi:urease accessory protein